MKNYFKIISAVFWLTVWALAAHFVGIEFILPSPMAVGRTFFQLASEPHFWLTVANSLLRVLTGFAWGVILGALLALLTSVSQIMDAILSPAVRILRSAPVASFIILVLLWVKRASVPGLIAMLMVIPVVWEALSNAVRETDASLLEMARAYRFSRAKTLRLVYIPSVTPQFLSACLTAQGLAWKSGVAAEVICLPRLAAGTEIYNSRIYLETPALFAWTAAVVILSLLLEKAFQTIVAAGSGRI